MAPLEDPIPFPSSPVPSFTSDERDLLLAFLDWKRSAVLKTAEGLTDEQARWTPDGKLLPVAGVIHHLTQVEGRWIDGRYLQDKRPPADPSAEFGTALPLTEVVAAYCARRDRTNEIVRSAPSMTAPCLGGATPLPGLDLRWAVLHVIDETSHHAGHADATREMLDGRRSTT